MTGPLNGEARIERQRFGFTVADLERLRSWLVQQAVTHVVMESTGSGPRLFATRREAGAMESARKAQRLRRYFLILFLLQKAAEDSFSRFGSSTLHRVRLIGPHAVEDSIGRLDGSALQLVNLFHRHTLQVGLEDRI